MGQTTEPTGTAAPETQSSDASVTDTTAVGSSEATITSVPSQTSTPTYSDDTTFALEPSSTLPSSPAVTSTTSEGPTSIVPIGSDSNVNVYANQPCLRARF